MLHGDYNTNSHLNARSVSASCQSRTTWGLSPLPILAELDTQLMIAEMQSYASYTHEMKSRIIGLMAAIREFAAALRK